MPVEQSRALVLEDKPMRTTSKRRNSVAEGRRHESVVSNSSRHSYRPETQPRHSSASQASTIKPVRRDSTHGGSVAAASSKAPTRVSTRFDAYYLPVDTPNNALRPDQVDDGLDDLRTIVPDDSISCVGEPKSYGGSKSRKSERRSDGSRVSGSKSYHSRR